MATGSKIGRVLVVAAAALVGGCVRGPVWRPERITLPALFAHPPVQGVVVSDFFAYLPKEPGGGDGGKAEAPEALRADISAEIASGLREAGLKARAVLSGRPEQLQAGEVLVRGTIRATTLETVSGELGPAELQMCGLCCTLGIYGGVLPFAVPFPVGVRYEVDVQVVDPDRNILMAGRREVIGSYSAQSAWGIPEARSRTRLLTEDLEARLAAEIARRLRE